MTAPQLQHDGRCIAWRSPDPTACSCRDDSGHQPAVAPAEVEIAGGHVALVDEMDLATVSGYRWRVLKGHNGKLYAYVRSGGQTIYMHRLIAGTGPGLETDHRNGNGLDNRRANLRPATASQNRANMGKPRRPDGAQHSSCFKGVSWDRRRRYWQAKISFEGRCYNLGRFDDEAAAARAYDAAAHARWGEFAQLNFPPSGEGAA